MRYTIPGTRWTRPIRNLVDAVGATTPEDEHIEFAGVQWQSDPIAATVYVSGNVAEPVEFPDTDGADPFLVEARVSRYGADGPDAEVVEAVQRALDASLPKAVEAEVWTGAGIDTNRHLAQAVADVTVLSDTALSPRRAFAAVAAGLASANTGGPGVIHATPDVVALWSYDSAALRLSGDRLLTVVRDDLVVPGTGYTGVGPVGHESATPPENQVWCYATGPVSVRLGTVQVLPGERSQGLNTASNWWTFGAQRSVVVTIEGPVLAVLVNLAA